MLAVTVAVGGGSGRVRVVVASFPVAISPSRPRFVLLCAPVQLPCHMKRLVLLVWAWDCTKAA